MMKWLMRLQLGFGSFVLKSRSIFLKPHNLVTTAQFMRLEKDADDMQDTTTNLVGRLDRQLL